MLGDTNEAFLDLGRRIPFLFSIVLVGIGPCGALLPEMFHVRYRYTGAGLGYNLAGVLGGAVPPLIAAPLASAYGSFAIGLMLAVLALLSLPCTRALAETKDLAR